MNTASAPCDISSACCTPPTSLHILRSFHSVLPSKSESHHLTIEHARGESITSFNSLIGRLSCTWLGRRCLTFAEWRLHSCEPAKKLFTPRLLVALGLRHVCISAEEDENRSLVANMDPHPVCTLNAIPLSTNSLLPQSSSPDK